MNAAIRWARRDHFTCAAVLIDPGYFSPSETPTVSRSLQSDGVYVIEVLDEHANLENVRLFMRACPFDMLFICSHCGEVGGERITICVPKSMNASFEAVIDKVVQFGSTKFSSRAGENVLVEELITPVAINGIDWFSSAPELREQFWHYYRSAPRKQWNVLHREKVKHVRNSTAIQLSDSALILNMGSSWNLVGDSFGHKIQLAAVEEDAGAVVVENAESASGGLD